MRIFTNNKPTSREMTTAVSWLFLIARVRKSCVIIPNMKDTGSITPFLLPAAKPRHPDCRHDNA